MITPLLIGGLGTTELVLIVLVIVLLFGASKLPELARGSGRALRIFKAETKGLMDEDDDGTPTNQKTAEELEVEARDRARQDTERSRQQHGDTTT